MDMAKAQLFFEDLDVGYVTPLSGGRTVTEADIVNFAGLSGDYNPIHIDAEFAKTGLLGQRVAHGNLVMVMTAGLDNATTFHAQASPSFLAFRGIDSWRFLKPVFIGDTINIRNIVSAKDDNKPNRGDVTFTTEILNQRGEIVQRGVQTVVMAKACFFENKQ